MDAGDRDVVAVQPPAERQDAGEEERRATNDDDSNQPTTGPPPAPPTAATLRDFYADIKDVDRENEVMRILGAFKLNPYEMLNLRFDVDPKDIPRAYRKVSLAVHPDKCTHPKASDAFETLGQAHRDLMDEEKKGRLDLVLGMAKDAVIKTWKKSAQNDAASQLAAALNGMDHVMETWMKTEEFHAAWKAKGREVLAKTEWRKRKLTQRLEEEVKGAEDEVRKQRKEAEEEKEKTKTWEAGREERVGSWREFTTKTKTKTTTKKKKDKDKSLMKVFKPPKPKPVM